jgi:hypothetical protein
MSNRRAVLQVKNVPLIDTFQFFGPNSTPGIVDFRAEWEASGPPSSRGMGTAVAPTDPGSFLGEIAPALSTGLFSGSEIGFEFESDRASTSPGGYAQLGTVRNGAFM